MWIGPVLLSEHDTVERRKRMAADEKPVLIAYDGSDHAKQAIEQAGAELRMSRKAVVVAGV